MSLLENLVKYRSTYTDFFSLEKPIHLDSLEKEEKMVKTHSSYSKKVYYDISKVFDSAINQVKNQCLDFCIERFPDYSCYTVNRKASFKGTSSSVTRANTFRITASRDDKTQTIYLYIELAFDRGLVLSRKEAELNDEEIFDPVKALEEYHSPPPTPLNPNPPTTTRKKRLAIEADE